MEKRTAEYISLCTDFLKGEFGSSIPDSLKKACKEMMLDTPPQEIAKIQLEAFKAVLSTRLRETTYMDRFKALVEYTHYFWNTNLNKWLMESACSTDMPPAAPLKLSSLKQHLEEANFMIVKLSEITEELDGSVSRLVPCERQLFKLQQISHTIIQNADFGVLGVDKPGRITIFNQWASRLFSIPETVIEEKFEEAFSRMPRESFDFLFNSLFIKGHSQKTINIDGELKVLEIVSNELLGKKGEREGAVLLIFDMTSREREKKVLEENIKLAAVGRLAAGVAHEIKNPLTVIKSLTQLMLYKKYDSFQTAKYLELICQEVDRANTFIQDFLNLGKPQKPCFQSTEACRIIEDTITLIQSQCLLNGVEIVRNLDCSAKVLVDPDQLKQVLLNLAKNSLEAMEGTTGKKSLTFTAVKNTKKQNLLISLTDTGCGIPEEILDKVTTSFFTTKEFGTGLGLNISKAIIEQHGGELKFFSSKEGTTATITLPLIAES